MKRSKRVFEAVRNPNATHYTDLDNVKEDDFKAYEAVRKQGLTNMLEFEQVILLSGGILDIEKLICIIHNYKYFTNKYQVA
jgi:hypothetical protein